MKTIDLESGFWITLKTLVLNEEFIMDDILETSYIDIRQYRVIE